MVGLSSVLTHLQLTGRILLVAGVVKGNSVA